MIEWKVITVLYIFFLYLLSIDRPNTKTSRSIKIFTYIFIPLILVSIFFVNIFNAYSYPGATVHFNDVFNPMSQVFNGASILVDLSSIYGLYPHFLNPIFNLVGLSVLSYSIIMSGFICLSYLCIFLLIRKAVANSLLVCLGFFSLIFYHKFFVGVYIGGGGGFDPYFKFGPIFPKTESWDQT